MYQLGIARQWLVKTAPIRMHELTLSCCKSEIKTSNFCRLSALKMLSERMIRR